MIILLGKTSTGKSSIAKIIEDKYKVNRLVTWTSRAKRPGEVGGVDYNFCSNEDFDQLKRIGFFAETTTYCMSGGIKVQYGTPIEEICGNKILVLNPEGFKRLNKLTSVDIKSFLITSPREELIERLKARGDSEDEYNRRLDADDRDFEGIDEMVDFSIHNTKDHDLEFYADMIWRLYNG